MGKRELELRRDAQRTRKLYVPPDHFRLLPKEHSIQCTNNFAFNMDNGFSMLDEMREILLTTCLNVNSCCSS